MYFLSYPLLAQIQCDRCFLLFFCCCANICPFSRGNGVCLASSATTCASEARLDSVGFVALGNGKSFETIHQLKALRFVERRDVAVQAGSDRIASKSIDLTGPKSR